MTQTTTAAPLGGLGIDGTPLTSGVVYMASGQGSQKPGMGQSLLEVPEVKETFECASDILGRDIAALVCTEGDEAVAALNETRNAQAAIATLSIGIGKALQAQGFTPDALLGFSLGQISALALASMMSTEDAFRLIDRRSELMDEAAKAHPGAMSALLKADPESVEAVCEQCAQGEVLVAANFNAPGQIVISGTPDAVARAEEAWKEQGKISSRLATQGGFHSPLMESACEPFRAFLETIDFSDPSIPLLCNTDGALVDAASIRQRLVDHLTHPVLFTQSVETLKDAGATVFVETGFGGVLSNLVKRIDRSATRFCVQDKESLDSYSAWAQENLS